MKAIAVLVRLSLSADWSAAPAWLANPLGEIGATRVEILPMLAPLGGK